MRIPLIIVTLAVLIFATGYFILKSNLPESEVSRINPIDSSNEPYPIETPERSNPVDSSNQPYPIVEAAEMPVVATEFVEVVTGDVTTLMGEGVQGTVVPAEPVANDEPTDWNAALMNLTSLNAELAAVEKMTTRNGLLPESPKIEAAFASLNRELDALKAKRLSEDERLRIREALQNTSAEMFGRIGGGLNARQGNHLVDLANAELARVMESLQGF